jgi:NAD(P)-binding Rossmann-like domain
MRRREFVLGAAVLAGGGAALFVEQQRMQSSVSYPGRELGHRLRDRQPIPEISETLETEVLIAGSGIAGLTAAWQLKKRGCNDVLLIGGPEWHGNAAAGEDGELAFPTGAHYLPLPSVESRHVREMLGEFGMLSGDPYAERPTYDERYLVHAPAERVLYQGAWQEGYLPADGISDAERADHDKFFKIVDWYTAARGSDGRRAFAVPLELSSADEDFRRLDRISFNAWLNSAELNAPTLRWYLNYCCRDDYGRHYDEISAWAGLHYFCSRDGQAANAERGAVLTWPQGLNALASRLQAAAALQKSWQSASVVRLTIIDGGVEALLLIPSGSDFRVVRVKAKHAIAAMPLFVLQHVFPELSRYGFNARDVPRYAPWLVSNFIMRAFPEEQPGTALAWDNVVYKEPGLGYVVSTHQDIRMSRPARTSFTAYHALSDLEPDAGRRWLDRASVADLTELAAKDLRLAYGWRLPLCVEKVAITVRAHAMAVPEPGFLSNAGRIALRTGKGPLYFAHSDLSGLSVFEEAAWWGYRAAAQVVSARR